MIVVVALQARNGCCGGQDSELAILRIRRACEHMVRNHSRQISLEEVSRIVAMERTYFSRFFKKQMGVGFAESLRQIRIDQAKKLLSASTSPITKIAFMTGFNDLSTFERTFRRSVGLSPRAYRYWALDALGGDQTMKPFSAGF